MRAPIVSTLLANRGVQIPLRSLPQWLGGSAASKAQSSIVATAPRSQLEAVKLPKPVIPKPSAAHIHRLGSVQSGSESADALPAEIDSPANERELALEQTAVEQISMVTQPAAAVSAASSFGARKAESHWNWARIRKVAFAAYFTTVGLLMLRMAVGLILAFRLWRRAKPINPSDLPQSDLAQPDLPKPGLAKSDLPISSARPPRVRVSPDLITPVTIASTILIPADYTGWDEAKLRIVLAHEQSHVKQGDFYLQLVAALHASVFFFSPLGWWLQRKLSELGEALSDRAGVEQADSPATYAQILLEFAAKPRKTSFFTPTAGVAMARNSNLSGRIDRILSTSRLGLSSLGSRRHAVLAAVVVPVALLAAVALVQVAPGVEAAQATRSSDRLTGKGSSSTGTAQSTGVASADQVHSVDVAQSVPPAPPAPPVSDVAPPLPPDAEPQAIEPLTAKVAPEPFKSGSPSFSVDNDNDNDDDAVAIVQGPGHTITMNGHGGMGLKKAREKYHDNFIWFERDGKAYVITDPQIVAQAKDMFKGDPRLEVRQKALEDRQHLLEEEMNKVASEHALVKLDSPEFKAQMDKLTAELAKLNTVKITEDLKANLTQEKIAEIQERVGRIQERLGDLQGQIGEKQGEIGERQGEIGERMGKIGEEMGKIGEEQGRKAEEAAKKLKSVIDQAVKDGKAKPVE